MPVRFPMAACLIGILASFNAPADAEPVGQATYDKAILPLLKTFCADCHSREAADEKWSFGSYARYADLVNDQKAWQKVKQLVGNHIMPPHGEPAPSNNERRVLLEWIDNAVFYVDPAKPDPGPITLRRLNRAEYNNAVRDVFGVTSRPADQFPADDSGYGFDNIGEVLSVSTLHLEKYLAAGREVAAEAVQSGLPPRAGIEHKGATLPVIAGRPERRNDRIVLRVPDDEVGTRVRIPVDSIYRVVVRAATRKDAVGTRASIEVLCDGKPIASVHPDAEWKGKSGGLTTEFVLVYLAAGNQLISLRARPAATSRAQPEGNEREKGDPRQGNGETVDSLAAVGFLGVSGPFTPTPPQASPFLRQVVGSRPLDVPVLRLSGEDLDHGSGRNSLDTGRAWFSSNGYRHAPVHIRTSGKYRVRFKVGAQQVGDEPVRFDVRVGERTLGPLDVTAKSQAEQWLETECELPAGQHDWQVWFVNEYKDSESGAERWFWLHEFSIAGPLEGKYGLGRHAAAEVLKQTARRVFRRPLTDEESQKILRLFDAACAAGHVPRAALQLSLEALLASPKFLYHPLPKPADDRRNGTARIDDVTLASRLSFFLWSSVPDEELLALAERGGLRKKLGEQVYRLLKDPKSKALTENFAGQWLQLRNLKHKAADPGVFPEFDAALADDMRRETELLFEHLLGGNRSVIEFLNADYTFVNDQLAKHYGLPVPNGEGFHRVALADSPRSGVITHGSILTLTSLPTRTSPVNRGKWILEQMLGAEPPPAPADVPPLAETRENESLPLRVRLEQHRANPACASCHAVLDPMGFALENYDAVGRWRSTDEGRPIDASGRLITGETFTDWTDLRRSLVRRRQDEFLRCLTEHLLTYALGRGITYRDKLTVQNILAKCEASNYGFRELILAVCESVPFQRMRIEADEP